jgi:hypothetical protein
MLEKKSKTAVAESYVSDTIKNDTKTEMELKHDAEKKPLNLFAKSSSNSNLEQQIEKPLCANHYFPNNNMVIFLRSFMLTKYLN